MNLMDTLQPQNPPEPKGARMVRGVLSKPDPLTPEDRREYAREYWKQCTALGIRLKDGKRKD